MDPIGGPMSDLPNWVYDVVIELQKWDDEWPEGPGSVLDSVPRDVYDRAMAIMASRRIQLTPDPNNPTGRVRVSWVPGEGPLAGLKYDDGSDVQEIRSP
jgi:hypothetical protein